MRGQENILPYASLNVYQAILTKYRSINMEAIILKARVSCLFILLTLSFGFHLPAQANLNKSVEQCQLIQHCSDQPKNHESLIQFGTIHSWSAVPEKAKDRDGLAMIIVEFHVPDIENLTRESAQLRIPNKVHPQAEAIRKSMATADAALRSAIHNAATDVLRRLPVNAFQLKRNYNFLPFIALKVSPEALDVLLADPQVKSIYPDTPMTLPKYERSDKQSSALMPHATSADYSFPSMSGTIDLIGAEQAWDKGYTGKGWHVAVIDTGIRRTHEFFQGKEIIEACFSDKNQCPNGLSEMYGEDAAAHHSNSYPHYDHGTHVSGIAAGQKADETFFGVAKDADIIAVNVFSKFSAAECDNVNPCLMSYTSDSLAGLNHVYSLSSEYNVGAANMSLGGGVFYEYCDANLHKTAIDLLGAAGIPTVIATGNDSYCGAVNSPSCVSTALAVMASTKDDQEAYFSNWHQTIGDIFAPGVSILSATGDNDISYGSWNGTSMATPHVAGGLTLLRQFDPAASAATNFTRLTENGPLITTTCVGGRSKPRINIDNFPIPNPGSLQVFIEPLDAVDAGAQWRVKGTSIWLESEHIEHEVPADKHVIEFREITGWIEPEEITVTVEPEENYKETGMYHRIAFSVVPIAGPGGSIYPDTPQSVNHGETISFNITPNTGYLIESVTGCKVSLSENRYTTGPITDNCMVEALFTPRYYNIKANADPQQGGLTDGSGDFAYGSRITVTATPNQAYSFINWTSDRTVMSFDFSYTFTVTRNITLTAGFSLVKEEYQLTLLADPEYGGSVEGAGSYNHGDKVRGSACPNQGWVFGGWHEQCIPVSSNASYEFTADRDRILTARFRRVGLHGILMLLLDEE
jgi:subtilisin family serine protease